MFPIYAKKPVTDACSHLVNASRDFPGYDGQVGGIVAGIEDPHFGLALERVLKKTADAAGRGAG